ncbi:MAG: tetratricopeptide repeat protein, partial [Ktedonobacteraceae bacterium]
AQAISGLGGIGKTQIAVEYAYRYSEHYQAILWVTASARDTLIADFVLLADLLDLPEKGEEYQNIVVRAVKLWLATTQVRWLLILDNVDDLEMITAFLPAQGAGDVLLTTRLQALGSIAHGIEVEKMGVAEGVTLLLRRTQALVPGAPLQYAEQASRDLAAEIVAELDGLPLALDQAGAYIEETRCGFAAYLQLYHTRRKELLQRRGRFPADHPSSVAATWSLSFQQVEQESPAAADLLRLLAFLHPEAIPEEILGAGAAELGPTLSQVASDALELNAAIGLLLRYSLLRRNPEVRTLQMHRLVQAVLKDSMERSQQCVWAERALRASNQAFPDVELHTWAQCQRMLRHAQIGVLSLEEYGLAFPEAARLLNHAANYLSAHARYAEAEPLLLKARAILEQVFAATHPATATPLNDLGALYLTQGKYQQAAPLLQQAREIREQTLGREHPATAASLHNLALLYYAQGRYTLAEQLY